MSAEQGGLSASAGRLRAEFDAAFARAHAEDSPLYLDFLHVCVAQHGYALPLSEVLAVHTDRKRVSAPGPRPELLGLVGLRGVVVPVYHLSLLLGHPAFPAPRWLAQVRAPTPFALAFERLERHLRVPASELTLSNTAVAAEQRFARRSVKSAAGPLPVLDLVAIVQHTTRDARPSHAPQSERRP